jgi:hypothetical protein
MRISGFWIIELNDKDRMMLSINVLMGRTEILKTKTYCLTLGTNIYSLGLCWPDYDINTQPY